MRILGLQQDNVKRIKAIDITPGGDVVILAGKNDQGKSSILDGIWWALAGGKNVQEMPIRRGESKASVRVDLGEIIVTRTFGAKGSKLRVESKDGAVFQSPQKMLDDLLGSLTFDPLAFTKQTPTQQREQLRELMGLDFTELDARYCKAFEHRRVSKKSLAELKARLNGLETFDDAPEREIPVAEILKERTAAIEHNRENAECVTKLRGLQSLLEEKNVRIIDRHHEILDAKVKLKEMEKLQVEEEKTYGQDVDEIKKQEDINKKLIDYEMSSFDKRIEELEATNAKVRANDAYGKLKDDANYAEIIVKDIDNMVKVIVAEKQAMIDAAEFPIEGLSFSDGGIVYNGLPFEQASHSEQLEVSIGIVAASNPKLRVMFIRDGGLIGDPRLESIAKLAEKHDMQVWIEYAMRNDDDHVACSIVIEDGTVKKEVAV